MFLCKKSSDFFCPDLGSFAFNFEGIYFFGSCQKTITHMHLQNDENAIFPMDTTLLQRQSSNISSNNNSTLPTFAQNASSLVNSVLFVVAYSFMMVIILSFYLKGRSYMKKNQIILLLLVSVVILIQYFGLLARIVYNGVGIYLNGIDNVEIIDNYDPIFGYRVTLWVSGTIENILVFSQLTSILVIMCFIQNML